ncbi:response regulator transcription factor [Streptomyces olivaceus]|uniref:response regulator transcription factor n=1 Tax=Streptomyces olivaceus TaxID=47716 RepID=UPI00371B3CDE
MPQQPYQPASPGGRPPEGSSGRPAEAPPSGSPAAPAPTPAPAPARVLVVDDDPTVAEVVAGYLERAGHVVDRAGDGPAALELAGAHRPDLVVLDLMLPGMDGLEVCRRLRGAGPVPVVMLTARGDEDDRILGLEVGADDYVTKPFSPRELVLRVESVLRRTRPAPGARPPAEAGPPSAGGLAVDPAARRATKDGTELALTLREFDLLAFFLRHPGRAFARDELMREVWGWDFGDLSTVTVHVRRLRGKVEDDPARPALVQTVWGVGYRFDPAGRDGRDGQAVRGEREGRDGSAVRGGREGRDGPAVRGGREGRDGSAVRGGRETG